MTSTEKRYTKSHFKSKKEKKVKTLLSENRKLQVGNKSRFAISKTKVGNGSSSSSSSIDRSVAFVQVTKLRVPCIHIYQVIILIIITKWYWWPRPAAAAVDDDDDDSLELKLWNWQFQTQSNLRHGRQLLGRRRIHYANVHRLTQLAATCSFVCV